MTRKNETTRRLSRKEQATGSTPATSKASGAQESVAPGGRVRHPRAEKPAAGVTGRTGPTPDERIRAVLEAYLARLTTPVGCLHDAEGALGALRLPVNDLDRRPLVLATVRAGEAVTAAYHSVKLARSVLRAALEEIDATRRGADA